MRGGPRAPPSAAARGPRGARRLAPGSGANARRRSRRAERALQARAAMPGEAEQRWRTADAAQLRARQRVDEAAAGRSAGRLRRCAAAAGGEPLALRGRRAGGGAPGDHRRCGVRLPTRRSRRLLAEAVRDGMAAGRELRAQPRRSCAGSMPRTSCRRAPGGRRPAPAWSGAGSRAGAGAGGAGKAAREAGERRSRAPGSGDCPRGRVARAETEDCRGRVRRRRAAGAAAERPPEQVAAEERAARAEAARRQRIGDGWRAEASSWRPWPTGGDARRAAARTPSGAAGS